MIWLDILSTVLIDSHIKKLNFIRMLFCPLTLHSEELQFGSPFLSHDPDNLKVSMLAYF